MATYVYVTLDERMCLYEVEKYKQLLMNLYEKKEPFTHFVTKLVVNKIREDTSCYDMEIGFVESFDESEGVDQYHYAYNGDYISHEEFIEIVEKEF